MEKWRQFLTISSEIDTPDKKRRFNERHFTEAACRYDIATRAMSLGRDQSWKKALVASLPDLGAPVCLDLASGTGDVAFLLAARYPAGEITGLDLSAEMVTLAEECNPFPNVRFIRADMSRTGFADGSMDLITGSYALRNAPDLVQGLREVNRILKPGGHAAFLDFSKSSRAPAQAAQYWLLKCWCGLWGALLHGNPTVHAYIADSLQQFPARAAYHELIRRVGFQMVCSRLFYFGMLELVVIRKGAEPDET